MQPSATRMGQGIDMATAEERLAGRSSSTSVKAFLSQVNRDMLYRAVTKRVHELTRGNVTLGPQPVSDFEVIMTSVIDVQLPLQALNERALEKAVSVVMGNVADYLLYLRAAGDGSCGDGRADAIDVMMPQYTRGGRSIHETMREQRFM